MFRPALAVAALFASALLAAVPAQAQNLITSNTSIHDSLCVGAGCLTTETYGTTTLRLKEAVLRVNFVDTNGQASGFPFRDWRIMINDDFAGGLDYFAIEDTANNTTPFLVEADAPGSALYIDDAGQIGFGTAFPQERLHVVGGSYPSLRIEQDGSLGLPAYFWDVEASHAAFVVRNQIGSANFWIDDASPNLSFLIDSNGDIGSQAGLVPGASFHIARDNGTASILVEETSATTLPRTLMNLQNNGRPEIVMGNSSTGGEWSFGAGSNFVLKQGAVGTASTAKTKLFEISDTGDAILAGSLTTGGTTCGGGCDRVFADDYDLPSISEHAARMFALGHLPNVGPTPEGAPFDLTDKVGRMLNELEHAHIFIARQEARIASLEGQVATLMAALAARADHRN